jgi:hypothetical protein
MISGIKLGLESQKEKTEPAVKKDFDVWLISS